MSENVTWTQSEFSPHVTFCHYFATSNVVGYSCRVIALSQYMCAALPGHTLYYAEV